MKFSGFHVAGRGGGRVGGASGRGLLLAGLGVVVLGLAVAGGYVGARMLEEGRGGAKPKVERERAPRPRPAPKPEVRPEVRPKVRPEPVEAEVARPAPVTDGGDRDKDGDGVLEVPGEYGTIQGALDAAGRGGRVRVGAGVYAEALNFREGVRLEGAGSGEDGTVVRWAADPGRNGEAADYECPLEARDCGSGEISGIRFEQVGEDADDWRTEAGYLSGGELRVRDCVFRSVSGTGVLLCGGDRSVLEDCVAEGCGGPGVMSAGAAGVFRRVVARGNGQAGFFFAQGATGGAEGCLAERNGFSGFAVTGAGTMPRLVGNEARGNGRSGFAVEARCNHPESGGHKSGGNGWGDDFNAWFKTE